MAAISSIQHFKNLQSLLEALAQDGIELQSHAYNPASFGHFTLVLAKGDTKARFLWDGRESTLTIDYRTEQEQSIGEIWERDATIEVSPPNAVFAEIASNATAMLL